MPLNAKNIKNVGYIGQNPELMKFIHQWQSVAFNYVYDENGNKFLYPLSGFGYCIDRYFEDLYVKMPKHPYDGDTFAILDITNTNLDRELASVIIDNTYDYFTRVKVLYGCPSNNYANQPTEEEWLQEDYFYWFRYKYKTYRNYIGNEWYTGNIDPGLQYWIPSNDLAMDLLQFIFVKEINCWITVRYSKEVEGYTYNPEYIYG